MNTAKLNMAMGIIAFLGGIILIFSGQTIMGISGAAIGALVIFSGMGSIKEPKDQ